MSKAQARRDAIATWWDRGPYPMVALAVDPGEAAGAAIGVCGPGDIDLRHAAPVETYTRNAVEYVVQKAVDIATVEGLPLVAFLEDWGAGGPRGLSQWIGLGEARGPWRRQLIIAAREHNVLTLSRIQKVTQNRWRSRVIEETGARELVAGKEKWRPFTPAEWKTAARSTAMDYFMDHPEPPGEDAAEATCQLVYAARSDEALKALGKRYLKKAGIPAEHMVPLEKIISMKK